MHETHVPALQTRFVPQDVPFWRGVAGVVLSTHVDVPVAQLVTPATHGFAGAQVRPAVHETQAPALQTRLVPHDAPAATSPVSAHTATPVEQSTVPVLQRFAGWQGVPQAADW